ncbi:hypothetical protein EVAR_30597_1 [Eumeta japonica]|uniref:Uncharacterized protein n=1 Tax=Eumeta variegata TaxID=151549 RepID=A0A4C1WAG8_EUMVA|nr:hypothetical protein EVAR_30597_1 [Eumeta japonica]
MRSHYWTVGVVSPTRRRPGMRQHKSSVPHPLYIHRTRKKRGVEDPRTVLTIRLTGETLRLCAHSVQRYHFDDLSWRVAAPANTQTINKQRKRAGDEYRIYAYDPETKQQLKVWVFQGESNTTKVIRAKSTLKQM